MSTSHNLFANFDSNHLPIKHVLVITIFVQSFLVLTYAIHLRGSTFSSHSGVPMDFGTVFRRCG